ncbi:hypothetical protein FO519_000082 [Halicephalobus sp. NKZ332]|nr:hypothetical protein FO519_000082 [Halicephalobus sp. NKZ332]
MRLLSIIVLIVSLITAESCTCVPPTQQNAYCKSVWISHAKILGKQNLGNSIEYTVQNLEIFKSNTSLMPNKVFTPSSSAACGVVNLEIGKDYLLSGTINNGTKALQLNNCLYMPGNDFQPSGVLLWSRVPADLYQKLQKKDFNPCSMN